MKKFIYIIFILISSFKTQASTYISPNCKNLKYLNSFLIEKDVHCETLKHFEDIFKSVQLKTNSLIPFPHVFVNTKSSDSWTTYGNLVFINQEQISWGEVKSEASRDMIWTHEIGHLIFQEKLKKDFSGLECFVNYMNKDADEKWKEQNPFLDTNKNLASLWSSACQKARDLQINYSELFADYIVAVVMNDLKAPFKYMQSNGAPKHEQEKMKLYDFTPQQSPVTCINNDTHFYFSPSRNIIGKKIFTINQNKAESINKLYFILKDDLLNYDQRNLNLVNCEEANKQLISKII